MKNDLDKQIDDALKRLCAHYPLALEAHVELCERLDVRNEESIDIALDLSSRLGHHDLIALYLIMRRYCHADRLDPAYASEWLHAYSVISNAIEPKTEDDRGWSVCLNRRQTALFDQLANQSK
jgi:hypothetical protein